MSSVTTQRLAEIPLFSNMDDEERRELRSLLTERIFQAVGSPCIKWRNTV